MLQQENEGRSILMIEDSPAFRKSITKVLGQRGFQVHEAGDAREAAGKLSTTRVDLVLLDLHFPGADGLTVLRELGRQRPELPVVVMSGTENLDDVIGALKAKARDYLKKPFRPDELIDTVERLLPRAEPALDFTFRVDDETPRSATPPPCAGRVTEPLDVSPCLEIAGLEEGIRTGKITPPIIDPRVQQIHRLMQRPSSGLCDVTNVIGRDPAMVAAVIGRANSGFFATSRKLRTLQDACVLLGNHAVFAIAIERLVLNAFQCQWEPYRQVFRAMVTNLGRTAGVSSVAARMVGVPAEQAYVAGLLHNIGEVLILQFASSMANDQGQPISLDALSAAMAQHHEHAGRALVDHWQLPEPMPTLCGGHHEPQMGESEDDRVLRSLVVGSWAYALGEGNVYLPGQRVTEYSGLASDLFDSIGVEPKLVRARVPPR